MKKRKSFLALLLALTMLLALPVQAFAAEGASVKLDKKTLTVTAGKSAVLKATVTGPSKKVTWKSSNTAVAKVSSAGKVSAKKAGKVTISATANGKTAKCVVTVKKAPDYVKQGEYEKEHPAAGIRYPSSDYVWVQKLSGGKVKFAAAHYGVNGSPIYYTNVITAKVVNNKASFTWRDSWGNSGTGSLTFGSVSVKLQMKTTKYTSGFNRWGWYESLTVPFKKKLSNTQINNEFKYAQK